MRCGHHRARRGPNLARFGSAEGDGDGAGEARWTSKLERKKEVAPVVADTRTAAPDCAADPVCRRRTSRTESPLVWQMWAWCSRLSTVARALGISSSNAAGCRLLENATEVSRTLAFAPGAPAKAAKTTADAVRRAALTYSAARIFCIFSPCRPRPAHRPGCSRQFSSHSLLSSGKLKPVPAMILVR